MFIPFIALIAFSISCKKSSTASASVTATVNGVNKSFGVSAFAAKAYEAGSTGIEIIAVANASTEESIAITIDNSLGGGVDSIVAGTYSDTSTRFELDVTYTPAAATNIDYTGGSDVDGSENGGVYPDHMTITITSISKTAIKGTFSGNIYLNSDPTQASLAVTNGTFSLPFTNP